MKNQSPPLNSRLLVVVTALSPLSLLVSHYDLVTASTSALGCVTSDTRFQYWTRSTNLATYPRHSWSREGWAAEHCSGVPFNSAANDTDLLRSTRQMNGENAPSRGTDTGWHRSTRRGSSGGVSGNFPGELTTW